MHRLFLKQCSELTLQFSNCCDKFMIMNIARGDCLLILFLLFILQIHLAEMSEMARHHWLVAEEDKLLTICERPAMIELYHTNRSRFYQDLSNEMNRGSHPDVMFN